LSLTFLTLYSFFLFLPLHFLLHRTVPPPLPAHLPTPVVAVITHNSPPLQPSFLISQPLSTPPLSSFSSPYPFTTLHQHYHSSSCSQHSTNRNIVASVTIFELITNVATVVTLDTDLNSFTS